MRFHDWKMPQKLSRFSTTIVTSKNDKTPKTYVHNYYVFGVCLFVLLIQFSTLSLCSPTRVHTIHQTLCCNEWKKFKSNCKMLWQFEQNQFRNKHWFFWFFFIGGRLITLLISLIKIVIIHTSVYQMICYLLQDREIKSNDMSWILPSSFLYLTVFKIF